VLDGLFLLFVCSNSESWDALVTEEDSFPLSTSVSCPDPGHLGSLRNC
jgi:hypothetical protein